MIRSILLGAASTIFVTPLVIDVALAAERRGAVGALAPQPLVVAPDRPGTGTGTVVYATSSIKCGNTIYEVKVVRSEEHTSELQSLAYLVCRLLLEKKKDTNSHTKNAVT